MATTARHTPVTDDRAADQHPGDGAGTAVPSHPEGNSRRFAWDLVILVIAALIGAFGTKMFIAEVFSIPSASMENTLVVGERVIVEKVSYYTRDPARGDVVVFDGSGYFKSPVAGGNMFVKRVIGLPGDRVACCDASGRLTVNGVAIDETGYLHPGDAPSKTAFDVIVPDGKLWLMGDHRSDSADSRAYLGAPGGGFIPEDRVVGRVLAVGWPLSSARSIDSPTYRS